MHYGCWDAYFASLLQKALAGDNFDGRFCVDVSRREFLCPLCKGLANCLVPCVDDDALADDRGPGGDVAEAIGRWAAPGDGVVHAPRGLASAARR